MFKLIESVFSDALMPEIGDDRKAKVNPSTRTLRRKNSRSSESNQRQGRVHGSFRDKELIGKCIRALDKELVVSPLQYTVQRGVQVDEATVETLRDGEAFRLTETETTDHRASVHSAVKYDLIGTIAEKTQLLRATIAEILKGIQKLTFDQFKTNPEDFILKAARIINEQKATVIIEHLAYDPIEDRHSVAIFTQEKPKESFTKAMKVDRHIYDYVLPTRRTSENS